MYKNQLQELAQRSCFNLPSYTCIREGPDHAPRFKATVNFNGEIFECPQYCSTLRQAEHSAAEVALNALSNRGPPHSLAARILDETGVYKNLLQEIAQRVGAPLPQYTTFRSGLGHLPVFTGIVELAGITFTGEPAKNKKQAEKNAAMAAWSALKQLAKESASSSSEPENNDELEQITIARALLNYRQKEKMAMSNPNATIPFHKKLQIKTPRPTSPQRPPAPTSKILPLICQKAAPRSRAPFSANKIPIPQSQTPALEASGTRPQKFSAGAALSYIPVHQFRTSCHGIAPPVTIRTAMPVYSAPPLPQPSKLPPQQVIRVPPVRIAPPVSIRQAIPVFAAPPVRKESPVVKKEDCPAQAAPKDDPPALSAPVSSPPTVSPLVPSPPIVSPAEVEKATSTVVNSQQETKTLESLEELKI